MISRFICLMFICSSFFLSGCSTNRSIIDVKVPRTKEVVQSNEKEVFINLPVDQRKFKKNPIAENVPSLNPRRTQTEDVKSRAFARKIISYNCIENVLLPRKKSVALLTQRALRQAFFEKGFKVIEDQNNINERTYIVDTDILTFWSWENIGLWTVSLSAEISTEITITTPEEIKHQVFRVKVVERDPSIFEKKWRIIMNDAVGLYVNSVKKTI